MSEEAVIEVTDQSFEADVLIASSTRPVVVDFWAEWCAPCRALGPLLEKAVIAHGGVTLAKLDVDANPQAAQVFQIQGIPAVKGFRDGGVAAEFVGLQQRPAIEKFLAELAPPVVAEVATPTDEDGLREALSTEPGNVAARRALARIHFDAGRLDEADALLLDAPNDSVCDGLRARIEMTRVNAGMLTALLGSGNEALALPDLIAAIRNASDPARSQLRRIAVGIIESEREHNPDVEVMRAQLASALF